MFPFPPPVLAELFGRHSQRQNYSPEHGDLRLQYCAVRDRPQGLLRVLIILIRTDFPALRSIAMSARYGRC